MRIENLGANKTVLHTSGATILFSYNTPVAAMILDTPCRYIRTNQFWSVTTSKHINAWLSGRQAEKVDQSVLNELSNR